MQAKCLATCSTTGLIAAAAGAVINFWVCQHDQEDMFVHVLELVSIMITLEQGRVSWLCSGIGAEELANQTHGGAPPLLNFRLTQRWYATFDLSISPLIIHVCTSIHCPDRCQAD